MHAWLHLWKGEVFNPFFQHFLHAMDWEYTTCAHYKASSGTEMPTTSHGVQHWGEPSCWSQDTLLFVPDLVFVPFLVFVLHVVENQQPLGGSGEDPAGIGGAPFHPNVLHSSFWPPKFSIFQDSCASWPVRKSSTWSKKFEENSGGKPHRTSQPGRPTLVGALLLQDPLHFTPNT